MSQPARVSFPGTPTEYRLLKTIKEAGPLSYPELEKKLRPRMHLINLGTLRLCDVLRYYQFRGLIDIDKQGVISLIELGEELIEQLRQAGIEDPEKLKAYIKGLLQVA